MMSSANLMWRAQETLHKKNNPIVPAVLMLLAGSLVVYRHMSNPTTHGRDHLKTFLAMIVVQMLPLVALEMKIMSCADPVGLFCKFATPVTLIHSMFLLLRVLQYPIHEQGYVVYSTLGLAGAAVTMHMGFKVQWSSIWKCTSVWGLLALGLLAAGCTETVEGYFLPAWKARTWGMYLKAVLQTANCYIELMAFVPAVWMVYREKEFESVDLDSIVTKRTSTAFFLFLVIFYFTEDIFQAYDAMSVSVLAAIAHVAHFLLLCDFAFFVLAHVYNPEKLIGELRKWLPKDLACEV